jgi:SNF2 family DNA or RNA helicase
VLVHHGPDRKKGRSFERAVRGKALVITSYSLLRRDSALLRKVDWEGVVLDEAQNIKNPETSQARAARALRARYRVALTGTPVENHVGELWSIMEFLNPGLLGTRAEFKRRFFKPIHDRGDWEAAERLRRLTGPFILRRVKTDSSIISDLPEKQEMKVFCRLTREQASLYAAVVKDLEHRLASAEGIGRRGLILASLTKLKQVCNHPAHFLGDGSPVRGRSGKLTRLTEMLAEVLEVGDRALIFTQFTRMGRMLETYLQEVFGCEVLFLHGRVPKTGRDRMVARFQERDGGPQVFILSLKAGGTGLNLTAANHVFHFDRWWNPAVEDQATDRTFRIGQRRGVLVHKFICAGTVEEKIDELIERKRGVADSVVGSGEAWLTELSDREIKEIVALRAEAFGDD